MVVPRKHLEKAVELWRKHASFPEYTTEPNYDFRGREGTIRGAPPAGDDPGTRYLRATEEDVVAAILQGPEVYDILDKWLAIACIYHLKSEAKQNEMIDACDNECYSEEYKHFFSDDNGEPLPIMTTKTVYDNGQGRDADYDGSVFTDPDIIFTLGNLIFGGAQKGGSTSRGARRMLAVGSEEDCRVTNTKTSLTTTVEWIMVVPLFDAVMLSVYSNRYVIALHLLPMYFLHGP